jgi:hypothetical protein
MMARRRWIQVEGKLYEVGVDTIPEVDGAAGHACTIHGDLPGFRSPIDGTFVEGRAALREHCKKHDVVPNLELKGLPVKTSFDAQAKPDPKHREETKRVMHQIASERGYFSH